MYVQQLNWFNQQPKVGVLRPNNLPPTAGVTAQHSLRAYLQPKNWLVLKSMLRDPKQYGYKNAADLYESVLTTDFIAPANLLKFVSCNNTGNCSTKWWSCKNNYVKCIPACTLCHRNQCKNVETEAATTNKD